MASGQIVFDVEYTESCAGCAAEGIPGVATGLVLERGGIICKNGTHKDEQVMGQQPASSQPASPRVSVADTAAAPIPAPMPDPQDLPLPAPLPDNPTPHRDAVVIRTTRDLDNGDIEVTLRIPDRHASAVKAEAEVQRQSLTEYLQEWIERALDNFWSR